MQMSIVAVKGVRVAMSANDMRLCKWSDVAVIKIIH